MLELKYATQNATVAALSDLILRKVTAIWCSLDNLMLHRTIQAGKVHIPICRAATWFFREALTFLDNMRMKALRDWHPDTTEYFSHKGGRVSS